MTFKKRTSISILVIADILIAIISAIMPLVFRFGIFEITREPIYLTLVIKWLPLDAAILIAVNTCLRLYNRVWTYASISEMYDCIKSAVITEAIYMAYKMLFGINMFRSYYPFNFMIMLLLLGSSRVSIRIIRGISKSRNKKTFE